MVNTSEYSYDRLPPRLDPITQALLYPWAAAAFARARARRLADKAEALKAKEAEEKKDSSAATGQDQIVQTNVSYCYHRCPGHPVLVESYELVSPPRLPVAMDAKSYRTVETRTMNRQSRLVRSK
jgi:hypothetical protein